jgi:hypothetical protein
MPEKKVCNHRCFTCKHPDCICDDPPSLREIQIIESHSSMVRDLYLTEAERIKRSKDRARWRERYNSGKTCCKKSEGERKKAYERTKAWRKKQREGMG